MADLIEWGISLKSADAIRKLDDLQIKTQTTGRGFTTFGTLGTASTKKVATAVTSLGADVLGLNGRMLQLGRAFGPWGLAAAGAIGVVTFAWKEMKREQQEIERLNREWLDDLAQIGDNAEALTLRIKLAETREELDELNRSATTFIGRITYFKWNNTLVTDIAANTDEVHRLEAALAKVENRLKAVPNWEPTVGQQFMMGYSQLVNKQQDELKRQEDAARREYEQLRNQLKVAYDTVFMSDLQKEIYTIEQLTGATRSQKDALIDMAIALNRTREGLAGMNADEKSMMEWFERTRTPLDQLKEQLMELHRLKFIGDTMAAEGSPMFGIDDETYVRAIKLIREEFENADPAVRAFNQSMVEFRDNITQGMADARTPLQEYNDSLEEAHLLLSLNAIDLTEFWDAATVANNRYKSEMEIAAQRTQDAWLRALQAIQQTMYQTFGDSDVGKILGFLAGSAQIYVNTKQAIAKGHQ